VHGRRYLTCAMPRPNYSIILCLIFLGLAVLVRTVVITQHAYAVLLPPVYDGTRGPTAATWESPARINAQPVLPPVVNAPPVEDAPQEVVAESPQTGFALPQSMKSPAKFATQTHRRSLKKRYRYRYYDTSFEPSWRPVVWY
jgi:hypothetical protein